MSAWKKGDEVWAAAVSTWPRPSVECERTTVKTVGQQITLSDRISALGYGVRFAACSPRLHRTRAEALAALAKEHRQNETRERDMALLVEAELTKEPTP